MQIPYSGCPSIPSRVFQVRQGYSGKATAISSMLFQVRHLFIYLFIYLFICLFIYLFIYLLIYTLHHKYYKLFNKSNVKISYSCMLNMKSAVQNYNANLLSNTPPLLLQHAHAIAAKNQNAH